VGDNIQINISVGQRMASTVKKNKAGQEDRVLHKVFGEDSIR